MVLHLTTFDSADEFRAWSGPASEQDTNVQFFGAFIATLIRKDFRS